MNRFSQKRGTIVGLFGGLVLLGLVAMALMIGSESGQASEESAKAPFDSAVPERELEAFAAFDSTISRSELSSSMGRSMEEAMPKGDTETLRGAVSRLPSGIDVAVTTNGKAVCINEALDGFEGSACSTVKEALEGDTALVTVCGPGVPEGLVRVVGLVPDGNATVSIDGEDQKEVPVASNFYEALLKPEPVVISAPSTAAGYEFKVELPLDRMGLAPGERCMPIGS